MVVFVVAASLSDSQPGIKEGTKNPLTVSDHGLVQRQQAIMKQQDLMMVDIESGVGRLQQKVMPHPPPFHCLSFSI